MNTPGTTKPTEYAIPKAQAGEVLKTLEGHGATFVHHDDRVEVTMDGATVTLRYLDGEKAARGYIDQVLASTTQRTSRAVELKDLMVDEEAMKRALDRVSIDREPVQPIQFMIGGQSSQPMNRAQRRAMAKRERKNRTRAGRR
jgi:hypothetical protein